MRKSAQKKTKLTLGDLYRRMSADFRAIRPEGHTACVMPMVVASAEGSRSNWSVEPLTSHCAFCRSLTRMIATEYASRFEVRYFPDTAPPASRMLVAGCFCAGD